MTRAYDTMPGVPAAGHIAGGAWHPGPSHHCTKCEPPPRPGTADAARWYLQRDLSYGLAADATIADARRYNGRYVYTPDGCAWVLAARATGRLVWSFGRATRAEQHLAHDRRTPTATRVDPDAVHAGDRIAWGTARGGRLAGSGTVEFATAEAVHVISGAGYHYPIAWTRVTGHWPAAA
jgi:hypothetical protein